MAGTWARDGAVQDQIDASAGDAVKRARSSLAKGESLSQCDESEAEILAARRETMAGVRSRVRCPASHGEAKGNHAGYKRRGSKDGQQR